MEQQNQFKTYVLVLKSITTFEDFSIAELKSLLTMKGIDLKIAFKYEISESEYPDQEYNIKQQNFKEYPLIKIYHNSEDDLKDICHRSISIQYVFEYLDVGNNYDELFNNMEKNEIVNQYKHYFRNEKNQYNFFVKGINKEFRGNHSINVADKFITKFGIQGKVKLLNEDFSFFVVECHKDNIDKAQLIRNQQKVQRLKQFLKNYQEQKESNKSKSEENKQILQKQNEMLQQKKQELQEQQCDQKKEKKKKRIQRKIQEREEKQDPEQIPQLIEQLEQEIQEYESNSLLKIWVGICRIRSQNKREGKTMFNYKFNLQDRAYLGPTSANYQLAFLMANQGQVQSGQLVLDPFVGTAGLLIPPSYFKAQCFGTDIDSRVIHGQGVGYINKASPYVKKVGKKQLNEYHPKIMINFEQYELEKPNIIRMDCQTTALRYSKIFDAIITDPPYGVRAASRKTGKAEKNTSKYELKQDMRQRFQEQKEQMKQQKKEEEQQKAQQQQEQQLGQEEEKEHNDEMISYAPTQQTSVDQQVIGLFDLGFRVLKEGGKLVYLFPVDNELYLREGINCLPKDPRYKMIDYSYNPLIGPFCRILITMIKLPYSKNIN